MRKRGESLADQFIEDSYRLSRHFSVEAKHRRAIDVILAGQRTMIRQVPKFHLDDEFVRMVTAAADRTTPAHMLQRVQAVTLPYSSMWIEFNLHIKVRQMSENKTLMYAADILNVPPQMGLLFELTTKNEWVIRLFTAMRSATDELLVTSHPIMYYFHPNGLNTLPDYVDLWDTYNTTIRVGGYSYRDICGTVWGYVQGSKIAAPDKLIDCCALAAENVMSYFMEHFPKDAGRQHETIETDIVENAGMMRWVITLLSIMQEVPRMAETRRQAGTRLVNNIVRPYSDFHYLTLKLPRVRQLQYVERRLRIGDTRRHRQHEVMGHWRIYRTEAGMTCDHAWVVDQEHGYQLCEKCESFGRHIRQHKRGDPKLGIVNKEYVIKGGIS